MKVSAFFAIFLFIFLAGCSSTPTPPPADPTESIFPASTEYGNKVIHLNVPNRLSPLQVRQAIQNAAYEDGWITLANGEEGKSGLVQLQKKTLFADTVITFLFQPTVVDGFSDSYTIDVTGKRTGRYTPPLRIDTIRAAVKKNLERAMAGY